MTESAVFELLRRIELKLDAVRIEQADLAIELAERLARLEQHRPAAPADASAEALRTGIAAAFSDAFTSAQLRGWAEQRAEMWAALTQLCGHESPSALQIGKALARLPGIEQAGERRGSAKWRLRG